MQSKYGEENVARIIAFGTMTPKSAIRKVFSFFEYDTPTINSIARLVPDLCKDMNQAYSFSKELKELSKKYKREFEIIERFDGMISHESQHAGGVIICKNLSSVLPVKSVGDDRGKRIVAFDKYMLEDLGHYKFDVLGLETLPILHRTLKSIEKEEGVILDLTNIDFEDKKVYDILSTGNVSGVFQLANQAKKVTEQKPADFKDLIAINALIRPGVGDWEEYIARRNGKEWSVHPLRLPYLKETEGLIAYQEQYLLDCKVIAGWDLAYADKKVRKNKDIRNDVVLRDKFISDSVARDIDEADAIQIWEEIVDTVSGGYGFNKSHSASYAVISYQTAYLKAYYPSHLYASMMSSEGTGAEGQIMIGAYIAECKQLGVELRPPDINLSSGSFIVKNNKINYKITALKGVGEVAVDSIIKMRPILSLEDLFERRVKREVNDGTMKSLIKVGCFDFENEDRAEMLWKYELMSRKPKQIKDGFVPTKLEWTDKLKIEWEKEILGVYLSAHPMDKHNFKPLDSFNDGFTALQGGIVVSVSEITDKNKNKMAFVMLDTSYNTIKVVVFAKKWAEEQTRLDLVVDNKVMIEGRRSAGDILYDNSEVIK